MEKIKNRKTPLISTNKLTNAVNLFHEYVDKEIISIKLISPTFYEFVVNYRYNYTVDLKTNKVDILYPDLEF